MLVLALDTTSRAGSVAVVHDDLVRVEIVGDLAITHGQRLPLALERALDEAGAAIESVDLFAVVAGPGSFTGLRVGIATVQGLAMAREKKVVAVSALEVLARAAADGTRRAGAWMDAQRGEVFAALYGADGRDVLIEPVSAPPSAVLDAWSTQTDPGTITFIGDGAERYREVVLERVGRDAMIVPPPPLAAIVGRIAASEPSRAIVPHAITPIYVRQPDAELARLRREQAAH